MNLGLQERLRPQGMEEVDRIARSNAVSRNGAGNKREKSDPAERLPWSGETARNSGPRALRSYFCAFSTM